LSNIRINSELVLVLVERLSRKIRSSFAGASSFSHLAPLENHHNADYKVGYETSESDDSDEDLLIMCLLFIGAVFTLGSFANVALIDSPGPSLPPFFVGGLLCAVACLFFVIYLVAQRILNHAKASEHSVKKTARRRVEATYKPTVLGDNIER
jgi:hypothetical protein